MIDTVNGNVIQRLKERAETGHRKYGVTMDRDDLSIIDWLRHAQDEALDTAVYLEKLIQHYEQTEIHDRRADH